jgi:hypothetical protein
MRSHGLSFPECRPAVLWLQAQAKWREAAGRLSEADELNSQLELKLRAAEVRSKHMVHPFTLRYYTKAQDFPVCIHALGGRLLTHFVVLTLLLCRVCAGACCRRAAPDRRPGEQAGAAGACCA